MKKSFPPASNQLINKPNVEKIPLTHVCKPIHTLREVSLAVFWEVAMNGLQNNPHMFLKLRHL